MYFYHGYALGVASTISKSEFTEADCALSITGGQSTATKSTKPLPPGISFQSANSSIRGWGEVEEFGAAVDVWGCGGVKKAE